MTILEGKIRDPPAVEVLLHPTAGVLPDPPDEEQLQPDPPAQGEQSYPPLEQSDSVETQQLLPATRRPMVFSSSDSSPKKENDDSNLPDGWKSAVDVKSGRTYYYNHSTLQRTWDRPNAEDEDGDQQEETEVVQKEKSDDNPRVKATSAKNAAEGDAGNNPITLNKLPNGWKSNVDPKSGRTYYYNHSTGERKWDLPAKVDDDDDKSHSESDEVAAAAQTKEKNVAQEESGKPKVEGNSASAGAGAGAAGDAVNNKNSTNKLPDGWKSNIDPKTGRKYYYNRSTGERKWDLPTKTKDQPLQESALARQQEEDSHENYKDEHSQASLQEKAPAPAAAAPALTPAIKTSPRYSNIKTNNHETENDLDSSKLFLDDPIHEQTYGRRIAMWMVSKGWIGEDAEPSPYWDAPSLAKAWAFFEHVTLSRFVDMDKNNNTDRKSGSGGGLCGQGDRQMELAEPGESEMPTTLYPIFSTPLSQLGDFGLGFGIYFATVRSYAILTFICGLICLPNILYFNSEEYSDGQPTVNTTLLKGSAICTNRTWVPCPTCNETDFKPKMYGAYEVDRFAQAWAVQPSGANPGFYLNVTDYLTWPPNTTRARGEMRTVPLDNLIAANIPEKYGISLTLDGGYIFRGRNITDEMLHHKDDNGHPDPKHTPLWCGYAGPGDCYLDLYPEYQDKDKIHIKPDGTLDQDSALFAPRIYDFGDTYFLEVGFVQKNLCEGATYNQGIWNLAALLVMFLGSIVIQKRASKEETAFDEDEQTAQDYSIVVKNPPEDAYDPEEWKQFFEGALRTEAGGVASPTHDVRVVTVDVDNEFIIGRLIERREVLRRIEMALPPDTPLHRASLQTQALKAKEDSGGCFGSKIPKLVERIQEIDQEIKSYFASHTERPPTTKVFLTFETEAAQRATLAKMTVPGKEIENNNLSAVPPHYLFRGKYLLHVREAHEPSTIRWQDLNASNRKILKRKIITSVITAALIAGSYFAITYMYSGFPFLAPILTTGFTAVFPVFAIAMMNYEKHHSDTSRQSWLFAKVGLYNVFITTVLFSLVTPFEATLDQKNQGGNGMPGLLPAVYALFLSQLGVTPGLQLLDIPGNLQRHILAPRAKTQEEMNLLMRGTPVYLAERYGNFIKFLYMALWYNSIYPAIFFLGSLAFCITYFVDRFSLMRSWARSPSVGAEISHFARHYFTPIGICLMSVFSAYYWSGFPYDNLCLVEGQPLPNFYVGQFDIDLKAENATYLGINLATIGFKKDEVRAEFVIDDDAEVYKYCNQDFRTLPGINFPALPQWQPEGYEWMEDEQENVVTIHGWTSVAVLIIIGLSILHAIREGMDSGTYDPRGDDQHIDFSDVPSMATYIPQFTSNLMTYPLLLCGISEIDAHLFEWQDPDRPHSYYDITNDVASIIGKTEYPNVFARIKYWPRPEPSSEQPTGTPALVPYPPKVTN